MTKNHQMPKQPRQTIFQKIHQWNAHRKFAKLVAKGYYSSNEEPLKCRFCESDNLRSYTLSSIDSIVCEAEIYCKECDKVAGWFMYGNYEAAGYDLR